MKYFTADLHFGDNEIIEREWRPFKDIKEFEDVFVENVNKMAGEADELYVLGDWINYNSGHHPDPDEAFAIVRRLNPKVILIMGNGEERVLREVYVNDFEYMRNKLKNHGFYDVLKDADVEIGGIKFHLIHCPMDHKKDCLNLFAHTHRGTGLWKPFGFNVCADLNYFRPFTEANILAMVETKKNYWDKDSDTTCM